MDQSETPYLDALRERAISDPGRFLAVIQLAITFIGFLASAFAGVSLASRLGQLFSSLGMASDVAGVLSLLIVTILLSLFTIVFGELVPKYLAIAQAMWTARGVAGA